MCRAFTVMLAVMVLGLHAAAQEPDFSLFNLDQPFGIVEPSGSAPKVSAHLVTTAEPNVVQVEIEMILPPGANTYSQNASFEMPTTFQLKLPESWQAVDQDFSPDHPPKVAYDTTFEKEVEKFTDRVVFTRRYRVPEGTDVQSVKLEGLVNMLVCDDANCRPQEVSFQAGLSESAYARAEVPPATSDVSAAPVPPAPPAIPDDQEPTSLTYAYEIVPTRGSGENQRSDPLRMQVELTPANAKPGELVTFSLTLTLEENWTTYALEPADDTQIEVPTEISLQPVNLGAEGQLTAEPQPELHEINLDGVHRSLYHSGRVTWRQLYRVGEDGPYGLTGSILYQICEKKSRCLSPHQVAFSLGSAQNSQHLVAASPVTTSYAEPGAPAGEIAGLASFAVSTEGADWTLTQAFVNGFLVGLLMNVLPCVLPVLAIKILSFVQQSGESHLRIFLLNLTYTFGVMAVFLAFAVLSWGLGESLGSVFQNAWFNIVMACIVFIMGLSLFGVFELPVPGIIPSSSDHQEGYVGAFNTGILATLLGTPCIGPFVAPIFAWTLTQSAPSVFAVFGMMGIGMAFPFLLTGIFPWMVNWLPRPGMWMVRIKQFTGFILMGTVIWLLFSIDMAWRVPVLVILLSLGLFVWMTSNLASPADSRRKIWLVRGYSLAASIPVFLTGLWMIREFEEVGAGAVFAAAPDEEGTEIPEEETAHRMPWQPFSEAELISLRSAGKPVFIDFTANWCVICKVNERVAIDRTETVEFIREHGFTPMMADFTKQNPEILKWLRTFGQDSVPLTIIIPPGKDSEIIALRGQYSQQTLLEKLRAAVKQGSAELASETQGDQVGLKR